MAMSHEYSDLQVIPGTAPELQGPAEKEVVDTIYYPHPHQPYHGTIPPRRVCGLTAKRFFLVLFDALIITAAAVERAVGATQSKKSKSESKGDSDGDSKGDGASTTPKTNSASSSTTPTPTTVTISTTTEIDAEYTLYRDCPSSNNTIYKAFGSSDFQFRKNCNIGHPGSGGPNVVNTEVSGLNGCINLCVEYNIANKTDIVDGHSAMCNAVCWRHGLDSGLPGLCFGLTIQNSTKTGFPFNKANVECDSGA